MTVWSNTFVVRQNSSLKYNLLYEMPVSHHHYNLVIFIHFCCCLKQISLMQNMLTASPFLSGFNLYPRMKYQHAPMTPCHRNMTYKLMMRVLLFLKSCKSSCCFNQAWKELCEIFFSNISIAEWSLWKTMKFGDLD